MSSLATAEFFHAAVPEPTTQAPIFAAQTPPPALLALSATELPTVKPVVEPADTPLPPNSAAPERSFPTPTTLSLAVMQPSIPPLSTQPAKLAAVELLTQEALAVLAVEPRLTTLLLPFAVVATSSLTPTETSNAADPSLTTQTPKAAAQSTPPPSHRTERTVLVARPTLHPSPLNSKSTALPNLSLAAADSPLSIIPRANAAMEGSTL